MKTAFFGGTFDPPHLGHTRLAAQVLAQGLTDRVLFVPAWRPPHKPGLEISPFEQRLQMLKLAIGDRQGFQISEIERRLGKSPSYTVEILRELDKEFPGDTLQLMIGSDSLEQLHSWYSGDILARERELITYPRPDYRVTAEDLARHWPPETVRRLLSSIRNLPEYPISSTEIRQKITKHENVDNLMEKSVYQYILEQNLYRRGQNG